MMRIGCFFVVKFILICFSFYSCGSNSNSFDDGNHIKDNSNKRLSQIANFPLIMDSILFIEELKRVFELEVDFCFEFKERINKYDKIKIYGSDSEYFFIEYDYGCGSGAVFPWKYQFLLDSRGRLVKQFSGLRYEFINVFPDESPLLLLVVATYKGNGGHEIYQFSNDTLENILGEKTSHSFRTYDSHHDNKVNKPYELDLSVGDSNSDGFNDLIFSGYFILIQGVSEDGILYDAEIKDGVMIDFSEDNPYKIIPVELIFLYDVQSKRFKEKEDYSLKYKLS